MPDAASPASLPANRDRLFDSGGSLDGLRAIDYAFAAYVVYYWALLYAVPLLNTSPENLATYLAYVVPTLVFPLVGFPYLVAALHRLEGVLLAAFGFAALALALVHSDLATARTAVTWVAPLLVIVGARPRVPVPALNALFLVSIPLAVAAHEWLGTPFSYVPDFSRAITDGRPGWRVSLFPMIPESAYFAMIVFIVNVFEGRGGLRPVVLAGSLYFVVFSGMRSAMLGAGFALVVFLLCRRIEFRDRYLYRIAGIAMFSLMLAAASSAFVVRSLASLEIGWINQFVFRDIDPTETLVNDGMSRVDIWRQHWRVFQEHPLGGVGTFAFQTIDTSGNRLLLFSTGSESALTGWLARIGVWGLLLPIFVYIAHLDALRRRRQVSYVVSAIIIATMLLYGSLLVPYSAVFLLLFGLACGSRSVPSDIVQRAPLAYDPHNAAIMLEADDHDAVPRDGAPLEIERSDAAELPLYTHGHALWQGWRVVAASAAACAVLAFALVSMRTNRYAAEAAVAVLLRVAGNGLATVPPPETLARLARGAGILDRVRDQLSREHPVLFRPQTSSDVTYSVRPVPSRDERPRTFAYMNLRVEALQPQAAALAANTWAAAVKAELSTGLSIPNAGFERTALDEAVRSANERLGREEARHRRVLGLLRAELDAAPTADERNDAEQRYRAVETALGLVTIEREMVRETIDSLVRTIETTAALRSPTVELSLAEPPMRPLGFSPGQAAGSAAVFGAMFSALWVIIARPPKGRS